MIAIKNSSDRTRFGAEVIKADSEAMSANQLDICCALLLGLNIEFKDFRNLIFTVEIDRKYREFSPTRNANDFVYLIERVSLNLSVDTKAKKENLPDFMKRERYSAWFEFLSGTRTQSSSEGIQFIAAKSCAKLLAHNIKTFGSCAER